MGILGGGEFLDVDGNFENFDGDFGGWGEFLSSFLGVFSGPNPYQNFSFSLRQECPHLYTCPTSVVSTAH